MNPFRSMNRRVRSPCRCRAVAVRMPGRCGAVTVSLPGWCRVGAGRMPGRRRRPAAPGRTGGGAIPRPADAKLNQGSTFCHRGGVARRDQAPAAGANLKVDSTSSPGAAFLEHQLEPVFNFLTRGGNRTGTWGRRRVNLKVDSTRCARGLPCAMTVTPGLGSASHSVESPRSAPQVAVPHRVRGAPRGR